MTGIIGMKNQLSNPPPTPRIIMSGSCRIKVFGTTTRTFTFSA